MSWLQLFADDQGRIHAAYSSDALHWNDFAQAVHTRDLSHAQISIDAGSYSTASGTAAFDNFNRCPKP